MFSKLKRILHPENMLFKMIILNCGLLLLVTLVLTAAGNYIYEESIAERSYANTMEIQNQVLKSLDLIFKSVEDNVEALGNYPEVQEYLKVDVENQQASRVELERQVRDLLLDYSRIYSEYLNIVVVSEKGQYLSNDSYRVKKLPLTEEKWYQDAVLANGELVLSPTSLGRNLKAWKNYSTDNYVSTAKLICDRQTSAGIGVILIDLELKSIQNLVEDITMGQTGFGYIQWMAKQYHAQDIVDLVLALSGFFRISLSQGKEFITLEQEVLMVKNYLDIQKVRYEDLFEYKTEIEEGLGNYMVLKICLQPLVENALYHGIKESDQDRGTIWIRAFSESEDSIILKVEDDGAGMSQERIDQLNSWLKLKERGEEVKAYGTLNVNDRIKIAYGDEYGLHYEKRTGGGTVAVVRLKRLQKEVCGKF